MLERQLEAEVMDDEAEAALYDAMDHSAVNERWVDDLIAGGPVGPDVVDVGTGTAQIPVLLCQRLPEVRVMAVDAAISMLELARRNIEIGGVAMRVQLERADAKDLEPLADALCDTVISNSLLHHLADPRPPLRAALRILRRGGRLFFRDLLRPASAEEVERLVATYAGQEPPEAQQLLRQSLHAALSLDEIRAAAEDVGIDPDRARATSDRHWTLDHRSPESGIRSREAGN